MTTAALQSFPHIAGSASAMMGFIQMAGGFFGGLAAALFGTPFIAFGVIIPAMLFISVLSYIRFASLTRRMVLNAARAVGE
jgi:DHA1 family purine ribonucleoside efflux pump-like MFS transporter/DHA1 family bicyclomycin/chloramphenicol resistance-like MFS transporter